MSLQDKRDILYRELSRANRKISAIKAGTYNNKGLLSHLEGKYGVDISGTKYDPRMSKKSVKRYTSRQLDAAINRLREFNSRNIGYYRGADGAVIKSQTMRDIVYQTKQYNSDIQNYKNRIKDTPTPWLGSDMTAGRYDQEMRPKGRMWGESYYNLSERKLPTPGQFTSDKAAKKVEESLKNNSGLLARDKRINTARKNIGQMIDVIGDEELRKEIDSLSDEQLWFIYTTDSTFTDSLSLQYEYAKNKYSEKKSAAYKRTMSEVSEKSHSVASKIVNYAKSLSFD